MQVVTIKDVASDERPNVIMRTLFDESVVEGARATFGTVTIPPGIRIPFEGTGAHKEDEYAVVIKGSIVTMSGDKEHKVSKGQATFIPYGEEHWAYNDGDEECEIIWMLIKR